MFCELKLPIPEDGLTHEEALDIAYAFSDIDISIGIFEENGNDFAEDLNITLFSFFIDKCLKRKSLIECFKDEFFSTYNIDSVNEEITVNECRFLIEDEDEEDQEKSKKQAANLAKTSYLLAMLIRAHDEWKNKYSQLTWEELESKPLPAVNK